MTCTECGTEVLRLFNVRRLKLKQVCRACGDEAIRRNPATVEDQRRMRRNRLRRERDQVMRDIGLVKTPYGWE